MSLVNLHPLNQNPTLRSWTISHPRVTPESLIYPVFVLDSGDDPLRTEPINSLPGVSRFGVQALLAHLRPLIRLGLQTVLLFGVTTDHDLKDNIASPAFSHASPVVQALKALRSEFPDLTLAADVCLCGYTSHGHCGILNEDESQLNNAQSISRLAELAILYAKSGAHVIAPSDMMDNRIMAIKKALVNENLNSRIVIMSYSAKFASVFYGPFRDAAQSAPNQGNRQTYQLPPGSRKLAQRAILRDVSEGADIIMIKPGYPYLDVVRDAANLAPDVPIAVYQVSGEYAMLWHGAEAKAFELKDAVMESLEGCMRAGATILITYYTPQVLQWISTQDKAEK